jgi:hypothetical protein
MVWSHRSQVGRSAFVLISFALAFMALCLRQSRWQLWLAQLAIVITLLIDLTSIVFIPAAFPANALDAFRRLDGVWEFLREHEGHDRSYFDSVVGEKYGQLKHVRTVTDYEPFSSRRLRDFMAFLQREPFPENHAFYGTFWALLPETARMKLVNIMAVRYVFIYQPAWFEEWWDAPPAPLRLVYEEDRVRIYENPAALPRAYVVHAVRAIADETALLEALDAPSFDPSREVLLTEQPEAMEEGGAGMDPDVPADVRFVRDDPEEVELLVRSKRPGFLVLSDSDYPGWVATVNGKPARIYRANYLFRAVPVGEGESTVVFRYEPASFRWGMRISLIAAAVWLVAGTGAVVSRRKRRKRTPG